MRTPTIETTLKEGWVDVAGPLDFSNQSYHKSWTVYNGTSQT